MDFGNYKLFSIELVIPVIDCMSYLFEYKVGSRYCHNALCLNWKYVDTGERFCTEMFPSFSLTCKHLMKLSHAHNLLRCYMTGIQCFLGSVEVCV
ncbi:hypothetical protein A4A49_06699 [Nicotiana attenuata]|uniref:Uncharacterized protein n=1 Tax=Nicotiana attenuata TaxID=49451 RepID=A0A314LHT7_NICAT|nr:hypothetical protein A4A49_06699 [Nicotiana attenuata]